ncbi:hypothetical protein Tco_0471096 [Tanacetum coccineum]
MTEPSWIDAMQEEIHEFERLQVWELVPCPDRVMLIKLNGFISDSIDTPMVEKSKLDEDLQGKPVDATLYHGMIGSLMYLTSSKPDLIYAITQGVRTLDAVHQEELNSEVINLLADLPRSKRALRYRCDCSMLQQRTTLNNVQQKYDCSIKEQVENEIVELYFVRTEYQLVDIFTKPLPRERFNFLIEKLGMRSMSPEMLKRLTEEEDE